MTERGEALTLVVVAHGEMRIGLDARRVISIEGASARDSTDANERDLAALLGLPEDDASEVVLTIASRGGARRLRSRRPAMVEVAAAAVVAIPPLSRRGGARHLHGVIFGDEPILVMDPDRESAGIAP